MEEIIAKYGNKVEAPTEDNMYKEENKYLMIQYSRKRG